MVEEEATAHDLPSDDNDDSDSDATASSFSAHLIRSLLTAGSSDQFDADGTVAALAVLMRFSSAVLVLVLTRRAANAIATSLAGNGAAAAAAGMRGARRRPAADLLGRRAASLRVGAPRPTLRNRLAAAGAYGGNSSGDNSGSAAGGANANAAARGFGRSKSMAAPSSVAASAPGPHPASAAATAAAAVQFKPLGSAPPIPPGASAGPHYVFLVHGWLGNEQEMAYLGAALEDVVAGRALSTSIEEDQRDGNEEDNAKGGDDDDDGFVHVTANEQRQQQQEEVSVASDVESQEDRPDIVVHKPSCNNGRTTDGIAAGGTRLAEEVADFIVADIRQRRSRRRMDDEDDDGARDDGDDFEEHVTVSFVGNSLGGLYSRYALSLLPSELYIDASTEGDASSSSGTIILHPNTFCTTATPHLGCSSNTYIPVPRFAERAIGRVLDVTGLDLFRADVEDYPSPQKIEDDGKSSSPRPGTKKKDKENVENDANDTGEARDDEPLLPSANSTNEGEEASANEGPKRDLIYRMCTEPAYLKPLSSFRRRIAYANAFGTDFQVPCNTASFLSDKSTYPHRYCNDAEKEGLDFIASVLYTDPSDANASDTIASSTDDEGREPEDDILVMSRSLDALGWTKVFIDTRSGIPVPALPKPAFMKKLQRQSDEFDARSELRNFVTRRKSSVVGVPSGETPIKAPEDEDPQNEMPVPESLQRRRDQRPEDATSTTEKEKVGCLDQTHLSSVAITLASKELVELMNPSERMHFPLGHTVMVANSKSGFYSKINAKGKPVMNKLAMELVSQISGFE